MAIPIGEQLKKCQDAAYQEFNLFNGGKTPNDQCMAIDRNELTSINLKLKLSNGRTKEDLSFKWKLNSKQFKSRNYRLQATKPALATVNSLYGIAAWHKVLDDGFAKGMLVKLNGYSAVDQLCNIRLTFTHLMQNHSL